MYSAQLNPAGLHPTLHISINADASTSSCALYAFVSLPAHFIADRFQLDQLHSEGRLGSPFTFTSAGATSTSSPTLLVSGLSARDLESPESRAGPTTVLLRIASGDRGTAEKGKGKATDELSVDIPLHARYLVPVKKRWGADGARQDMRNVTLQWPAVFHACGPGDDPPNDLPSCDPVSLPTQSLPSRTTSIHFLLPHSPFSETACPPNLPTLALMLPSGVLADLAFVELANFVLIWAGALWIVWKAASSPSWRKGKEKARAGKVE